MELYQQHMLSELTCSPHLEMMFLLCVDTFRTMPVTNSSFLYLVGTPLNAASFQLSAMRDTYSPLLSIIVASFMAASFNLHAMRDANSSLNDLIGTPLKAALFTLLLSTMCDTNSSLHYLLGTSIKTASFPLSAMGGTPPLMTPLGCRCTHCGCTASLRAVCDTNPSLNAAAFLFSPYPCFDTRLRFFGNRLFLQSVYLFAPGRDY